MNSENRPLYFGLLQGTDKRKTFPFDQYHLKKENAKEIHHVYHWKGPGVKEIHSLNKHETRVSYHSRYVQHRKICTVVH